MKSLIIAISFLSTQEAIAEQMRAVTESLHGDKMAVEYVVLNSGQHVLLAKEIIKQTGQRSEFKEIQKIELNVKDGELVSIAHQFKCKTSRSNDFIYAVIAKSKTKEKGHFHPERAWAVEENKMRLRSVKPKAVHCEWSPEADAKYPF